MSRYVLSVAAQNDIDDIIDHLLENASIEIAAKANDHLEEALSQITTHPEIGHQRKDLASEPLRFWQVDSYLILYCAEVSPIAVVRILHGKRDIKALLNES
jgi:toxin ParE1/3/4